MAVHSQPPCIPLKDDSEGRIYCDPCDTSGTNASSHRLPFLPLPGTASFPVLPPLVYRRTLTAGGMGTMDAYESSPSRRSSSSHPTSTRQITPFKEEVSARGSARCAESRAGLSTARSSSMSINSPASNAWVMATMHGSTNSVDDAFGRINRIPLRFQRGKVLGSGGSGTVYQAMLFDGALAAVKKMKLETNARTIDKEIRVLSSLPPHPHCIRYLGSVHSHQHYYIIMEYLSGGSIQFLRSSLGRFREPVMQSYIKMVLMGLQHLHSHKIIHRDIKGANVLLDEKGSAKIADFGCCKILNQPGNTVGGCGTPLWMAPEVCRGESATAKSDVWGVGCLCLEMTNDSGMPWDFPAKMNIQGIAYAIASAKQSPEIPTHLSSVAQNFIRCCLQIDPDDRLTVEELLQHPFFSQDHAALDSTDEDIIISREESIDLYSSHSKIRFGRIGNLDRSDNNNNLKVIVSATSSTSSTRIKKCREDRLEGFRLETISDDDDDDDDDLEDITAAAAAAADDDDDDVNGKADVGDDGESVANEVDYIVEVQQKTNTDRADEGVLQRQRSSNSHVAVTTHTEMDTGPPSHHSSIPLQRHASGSRSTAAFKQPCTNSYPSTQVVSRQMSPLGEGFCGRRSSTASEISPESMYMFPMGPIVWESSGSDNVKSTKHLSREAGVSWRPAHNRRRTSRDKSRIAVVLKWFTR